VSHISGRKEASYGKVHIGICEKGNYYLLLCKKCCYRKARYRLHQILKTYDQAEPGKQYHKAHCLHPALLHEFLIRQRTYSSGGLDLKFSEQSEHFSDFLMEVKQGAHTGSMKEVKNNTANSYLQAVFGLYDFLHRDGTLPYLKVLDDRNFSYVMDIGTTSYSTYKTFDGYLRPNKHTARTVLAAILNAYSCNRDRLLLLLLEETGIRIGEALGIKYTEDIDFTGRRIFVRYRTNNPNDAHAKNAEERCMRISDSTFALLNVYLAENAVLFEKTDYLFIVLHGKTRGNPLSANSFYTCLETIGKKAGLTVTNHMLGHYFANSRREAGWEILDISLSIGHKSIKTTIDYLDEESRLVEKAQEQYLAKNEGTIPISDFL